MRFGRRLRKAEPRRVSGAAVDQPSPEIFPSESGFGIRNRVAAQPFGGPAAVTGIPAW